MVLICASIVYANYYCGVFFLKLGKIILLRYTDLFQYMYLYVVYTYCIRVFVFLTNMLQEKSMLIFSLRCLTLYCPSKILT